MNVHSIVMLSIILIPVIFMTIVMNQGMKNENLT